MKPAANDTYAKHFEHTPLRLVTGSMLTRKARDLWSNGERIEAIDLLGDTLPLDAEHISSIIDGLMRLTGQGVILLREDNWIRPTGYPDFAAWMRRVNQRFAVSRKS